MNLHIRNPFAGVSRRLFFTAVVVLTALAVPARADDTASSAKEQERAQIQVLQSDAPPGDKGIACKKLTIYGTEEAVPVLAPLLADPQLASWARIAMEAIPGSAPDEALRKAAGKLNGRLLVGVINSIGVRRDGKSVSLLAKKLNDSNPEVAAAAAVSLGKIGDRQAAAALRRALVKGPDTLRPAYAEGCVRCAENLLADGQRADAVKMYDAVCHASLPGERTLEGLRGAILTRGTAGIPLLVIQLHSTDREYFYLGLRVARELPGREATEAVVDAYERAASERQPLLLLALSDREDPAAMPVITAAARNGAKELRLTAIDILDRSGDPAALPVLLTDAADEDPEVSDASMAALTRMAGNDVDSELTARLQDSSGRLRRGLITLSARRGIKKSLPLVVQSLGDTDADLRGAAIQALKDLGGSDEVADLAHALEKSTIPAERAHIESVLDTLSGRIGAACVPSLLSLLQSAGQEDRKAALQALVAAGGSDALTAVAAGTGDSDSSFQDEAVRALCSWPNVWPEDAAVAEPLLRTAKTDANASHQILAMRGYLQFLLGDEKLNSDDKLAKLQEILPLLQRPEEKITAIAVLQAIPVSAALDLLATFASDPAVANDACAALVQAATQNKSSLSTDQRHKALQLAIQDSSSQETRQKAEEALKGLQ
jgi:HEAT repeat protein